MPVQYQPGSQQVPVSQEASIVPGSWEAGRGARVLGNQQGAMEPGGPAKGQVVWKPVWCQGTMKPAWGLELGNLKPVEGQGTRKLARCHGARKPARGQVARKPAGAMEPGSKGPGNLEASEGPLSQEPVRFREPGNQPVSQCGAREPGSQ